MRNDLDTSRFLVPCDHTPCNSGNRSRFLFFRKSRKCPSFPPIVGLIKSSSAKYYARNAYLSLHHIATFRAIKCVCRVEVVNDYLIRLALRAFIVIARGHDLTPIDRHKVHLELSCDLLYVRQI